MAGERVLVVEDNEKNMKLFRDVLQARDTAARGDLGRAGARAGGRAHSGSRADGHPAAGHRRHRGAPAPPGGRADRGDPGARADRAGDVRRPRTLPRSRLRRLHLQARRRRRARSRPCSATATGDGDERERRPKILVVDDVPENVRLLEAVLVPHGYHVVAAGNGARGARGRRVASSPISSCSTSMMPRDGRLRGLRAPA